MMWICNNPKVRREQYELEPYRQPLRLTNLREQKVDSWRARRGGLIPDLIYLALLPPSSSRIHAELQARRLLDHGPTAYGCGRCRGPHHETWPSRPGLRTAASTKGHDLDAETCPSPLGLSTPKPRQAQKNHHGKMSTGQEITPTEVQPAADPNPAGLRHILPLMSKFTVPFPRHILCNSNHRYPTLRLERNPAHVQLDDCFGEIYPIY